MNGNGVIFVGNIKSNKATYSELEAQLNFYKNHAKYADKKALENEEKYKEKVAEIKHLTIEIAELKINYNWILEQLKISKKKNFGSSSESYNDGAVQLNFFNEAEAERTPFLPEPKVEEITYKRKKKSKRSLAEMYGNLHVIEVINKLSEEEKTCDICGSEMSHLRFEENSTLKFTPAKIEIIKDKREVCVCKNCDKNSTEGNFKTANGTPALIEKSLVTPSLMAHIMNQKFCNAMPLYRQEQELKRMDVKLSRQTLSNWMIAGANLLKPLYKILRESLVSRDILHADETPVEVLNLTDRDAPLNAYMWVYRTGRLQENPVVIYDYQNGRSGDYPKNFLSRFSGYLHCDGYAGYSKVENIKRVGCWAHARRKFIEALEIQPNKKDLSTLAGQALKMIDFLFHIEGREPENPSKKSNYTIEQIAEIRKEKSAELASKFFEFCEKNQGIILPKSHLGGAVAYALNQKETLLRFLENPLLELSNNAAERAVKPFVIGRKNWLFCNTVGGANSSAIIYSLIETAKENNLKPYDYLEWVFENIKLNTDTKKLLPWSDDLPQNIKLIDA